MRVWMGCVWLACASLLAALPVSAQSKPSVLFCSPQGAAYGWVDLTYLSELNRKGFEVDYTANLSKVSWDRIKNYNVLVIYALPGGGKRAGFVNLIERYLSSGGGVFVMPTEQDVASSTVAELTKNWGVRPLALMVENDREKIGYLSHASYGVPLAYTEGVLPSPVSEGVKAIWYPYSRAYDAQHTLAVSADENWQVVVKASGTAVTEPGGAKEPPLFVIRPYKKGRIALMYQWRQYSIGQGTKWIYDREVLSKGLKGKPSGFGRLLENTFRWLAEPSLRIGSVGGYRTPPGRLLPPNRQPGVKEQYEERFWHYEPKVLGYGRPRPGWKIYRGLIGAKSSYSSGKGTVQDYARAARRAGLDFVVFMEDFEGLTQAEFESLKKECSAYSDETLRLLPGFAIRNNIGNHLFMFGLNPAWPPDECLTGPNKKTYYWQEQDDKGNYTGYMTPAFNWTFSYHTQTEQLGYYNFSGSGKGIKLPDLRMYAMAAVRYYKDGRLVEDVTDDYLTTAQGTLPPAPVSVNEVRSPEELIREAASGHSLTFAQARSLDTIMQDALRWSHQYDGLGVFASDGPIIRAWPTCHRASTLGAENFVTGPAVMPSAISVASKKGLKEIRIYNGEELFRRFLFNGQKEFNQTLVLDGTIQKDLVLVAEDVAGGRAVSFARRCWKDGGREVVFCSDHVNDCKSGGMLLGRGPVAMLVTWCPPLPVDIAGGTWDGGPPASLPLVDFAESRPALVSDRGTEDGTRFDQTPLLEFSDEGAVAVASRQQEVFDKKLVRVVNPWHTYGPIAGPSRLMKFMLRYREFYTPTVGVPETGWAGPGVRRGINGCLFRSEITFKQDQKIASLCLLRNSRNYPEGFPQTFMVTGSVSAPTRIEITALKKPQSLRLAHGDWFGLFSPKLSSSHLFVNRGLPLILKFNNPARGGQWFTIWADLEGKQVKSGESYVCELFSLGFPVDVEVKDASDLTRIYSYLREPTGMKVLRGRRLDTGGLLEFAPDDYAVALLVPKPPQKTNLTLPVRVTGLNRRWSAGLFQKTGYVKGDYGTGQNRYRALGVDVYGNAYVPLYVDLAEQTHIMAGHPVVAGPEGKDLFIQVTKVANEPPTWHVSVNNPTDRPITTTLRKAMDLPGLQFPEGRITLRPGAYVVIR